MNEVTTGLVLELTRYGAIGIIVFQMGIIIYLITLLARAYRQHQDMFQQSQIEQTKATIELARVLQQLADNVRDLK